MKPLYRIGKYHNLEKLDKIAKYVQNFAQLQPIAGSVDSPFNWLSEYDDGIFFTLSVGWHVDYRKFGLKPRRFTTAFLDL